MFSSLQTEAVNTDCLVLSVKLENKKLYSAARLAGLALLWLGGYLGMFHSSHKSGPMGKTISDAHTLTQGTTSAYNPGYLRIFRR